MERLLYLPPGVWRLIGLALLEADDRLGMRSLCVACKDAYLALEPEFADLFGRPLPHSAFRSEYLVKNVCLPFVTELRRQLGLMHATATREGRCSSLLVVGGIGDVERTVTQSDHAILLQLKTPHSRRVPLLGHP
jgi:hypothetical protein